MAVRRPRLTLLTFVSGMNSYSLCQKFRAMEHLSEAAITSAVPAIVVAVPVLFDAIFGRDCTGPNSPNASGAALHCIIERGSAALFKIIAAARSAPTQLARSRSRQ